VKKIINILALNLALLSAQLCGAEFDSEFGKILFQSEAKHPVVQAYQTIAAEINFLRNQVRDQQQYWNKTIDWEAKFSQGLINPNLIAEAKQKIQPLIAKGYEVQLEVNLRNAIMRLESDQNQLAQAQIIKDYYNKRFGLYGDIKTEVSVNAALEKAAEEFNQSRLKLLYAVNDVRNHPLFIKRQQIAEAYAQSP
jgi:hypothetical protein